VDETEQDLGRVQGLLDASLARAGPHLLTIFGRGGHYRPVPAKELSERMTGMRLLALATVTPAGAPRVSPVDGLLFRGDLHFSTAGNARRLRDLGRNPAVSATHFEGEEFVVVVHGTAVVIRPGHPEFEGIDGLCIQVYGQSATEWGPDVAYVRIEPSWMLAQARAAP
jgi:Pyridoxamine 5'-phosphate oxidase